MAQAPVFDASMPASMNYGGLGFIIGHEYTHSLGEYLILCLTFYIKV